MPKPLDACFTTRDIVMHLIAGITVGIIFGIALALGVMTHSPPQDKPSWWFGYQCEGYAPDYEVTAPHISQLPECKEYLREDNPNLRH